MKQVFHIFAKDIRHQWLEVLLSLAFIATLVLTTHNTGLYGAVSFSAFGLLTNLTKMLKFVIPLGWWLLISPLIHDERLVGDRQFWLTRPYEWKMLLAAKVLFLVVFLDVPLLLAQFVILARAGFSPLSGFPSLLYDLLLLTCALVLPLVALATVTRNFARMTLAVLGALACLVAIVLLATNASEDRVAIPHGDTIAASLAVCLCLAVVVLQYARRRVKVSWVLLGLLVVLSGAFSMGGAPDDALMDRTYPRLSQTPAPIQFAYRLKDNGPSAFVARKARVGISVPVHISGVAEGSIIIPNFLKVTLQAPDGSHWTSAWQPISTDKYFPGEKEALEQFTMPRATYDVLKGKSLNVNMAFAVIQARIENTTQIHIPIHEFTVPKFGICTPLIGVSELPDDIAGLTCRAPLTQPELTLIRTLWSDDSCATRSANSDDGIQTAAWTGSLEPGPVEFGIIPIWSAYIDFTNRGKIDNGQFVGLRKICPGTLVTFTAYKLSARTQSTLSISGFQLPELNRGQQAVVDKD